MIWTAERRVEFYRRALLRLVVGLYALAESVPEGDGSAVLPRHIRNAILKVLRPAESAARRLIFVEAQGMEQPEYVPPPARAKTKRTGTGKKRGKRKPLFCLIDPRKFLEELYPNRRKRRSKPVAAPTTERTVQVRYAGFDGQPDFVIWSEPKAVQTPDDLLNAAQVLRRMEALKLALEDVPAQARRMIREIAKRKQAPPGPGCVPPLRYGLPPGYRKRRIHWVDRVLSEFHQLAVPPKVINTS